MKTRVAIIGAGFGGLTAAVTLAARGAEVVVLEAGARPGGKADEVEVDGVRFDTGPSLLTLPHIVDTVFRLAGRDRRDYLEWTTPTPAFRYHYADGTTLDVHHDADETLASIETTLGADARDEARAFLDYCGVIWEASAPHFVFGDAPSLTGLITMNPITLTRALSRIDATSSMWEAISARIRSPHLRALFARYATYNGSDVRVAPATLNCIAHVELALGGYGVRGGMHQLPVALQRLGEELGVEYRFETPVIELDVRGRSVSSAVLADGTNLEVDAIVSNADVAHLRTDLLPGRFAKANTAVPEPSMSAYNFVYEATGAERHTAHQVFFPDRDYLAEFADIFDAGSHPADPTIYVCNQRASHGRATGPRGGDPVFVMVNAPASDADHSADVESLRRQLEKTLIDKRVITPDDRCLWQRSPSDLAGQYPGSRGSIYGPSSNSRWSAFQRASNRDPKVRGLYIASGSAHPGGGVPLCVLSGLAASRSLLRDHGERYSARETVAPFTPVST